MFHIFVLICSEILYVTGSQSDLKAKEKKENKEDSKEDTGKMDNAAPKASLPRNASQPAFTTHVQGLPKNGSVPFFDRMRKTSQGERYKPSLQAIKVSRPNISSNGDVRRSLHLRLSTSSVVSATRNNNDDMWSKTDVSRIYQISFYILTLKPFLKSSK